MHLGMVQTLYRTRGSPFRKFPLTALCRIDAERVVSRPVYDGTPFAPTQGLHFQALLPLSFFFICTMHWCKRCTALEEALNLRKFRLTALYGFDADRVVSKPVLEGTLFAPTQGLHLHALLPLSFLFICILHWCKLCTGLDVALNFHKFT